MPGTRPEIPNSFPPTILFSLVLTAQDGYFYRQVESLAQSIWDRKEQNGVESDSSGFPPGRWGVLSCLPRSRLPGPHQAPRSWQTHPLTPTDTGANKTRALVPPSLASTGRSQEAERPEAVGCSQPQGLPDPRWAMHGALGWVFLPVSGPISFVTALCT